MFKHTIRAFTSVLAIVIAMVTLSSISVSKEAATQAEQTPPQMASPPAVTDWPEDTEAGYRGIEPDVIEPPGRAGFTYYPDVALDEVTQDFIFVEAGEAAVDYELVLAIIIHESRCDPSAISKTNDYGLMQVNQINHAWLAEEYGLTDMLDPRQNIIAGITILARQSQYNDGTDAGLHKMLMAYNMGPTGAANAWARGTYSTAYTREVMQIRTDMLDGKYGKVEE